jgi:hypothetical protein
VEGKKLSQTVVVSSVRSKFMGTDEMNFAEFPLAALTDHLARGQKTLVFEDDVDDAASKQRVHRKLIVSGSDLYGLPTPLDSDVLLIAVDHTSRENAFSNRQVPFRRSDFLTRLGWDDSGKSYRRLDESLQRWAGTTLYFVGAWWDRRVKRWQSRTFHVLESLDLKGRQIEKQRIDDSLSTFTWNEVVFASFQANNLRRLDLSFYFSLARPASQRMFRFLDKRFWHSKRLEFDLPTFAFEHVGYSRTYDCSQLKRKMRPAIDELVERGFLRPTTDDERFHRKAKGDWIVRFEKASRRDNAKSGNQATYPLIERMVAHGVRADVANELLREAPVEQVLRQLEVFERMRERNDKRVAKNPPGFLVAAIRGDFAFPKEFARQPRKHPTLHVVEKPASTATAHSNLPSEAESYWNAMTADEKQKIEADAMSSASGHLLDGYRRSEEAGHSTTVEEYRRLIVDRHLVKVLSQNGSNKSVQ